MSWPRSGHHLLQRIVQRYFGDALTYCDFYPPETPCCRAFPCARPDITFSKNHDFKLEGRILPGVPYLVQYRGVVPAIISDFELYLRATGREDTAEHFRAYASSRAAEWAAFMAKWVDTKTGFERLLVPYETLVSDPVGTVKKVASFFEPGAQPDEAKIADVVASESHQVVTKDGEEWRRNAGVKAFRRVEDFRFYDPVWFAELEAIARRS